MVPIRESVHVPIEVYLAVMKETAPAAPEHGTRGWRAESS
jgi:hypothetical protein